MKNLMTNDIASALAIPATYRPNITSPCRLKMPQTSVAGMKAEMISV